MTRDISGRFRPRVFSVWRNRFSPSNRRLFVALVFVAAAAGVGAIGWSGEVLLLPVACVFPALWAFAPTRLVAGLVSMGYFMAASRGLPVGVSIYFATDMWLGLVLWVAASLSFVIVHTVLWTSRSGWRKAARYGLAAILMSVPPFGIVGWAGPITAAGVLFPGWGWLGLAATAVVLSAMSTPAWSAASLVLGATFALSVASGTEPPKAPAGWAGVDTEFDYEDASRHADYDQHLATIALVREAARSGVSAVVLPESALGIWTATTEHLWVQSLQDIDVTVEGGAIVVGEISYDNVMVEVSGNGAYVLYRERMPVPISMWQPWKNGGAHAFVFANPVVEFAGARIAPLICYEQLLVWPVLQSMLFGPQVIVATGNGWWTGETDIVAIQKASAQAWASLFRLPLVIAFNRSGENTTTDIKLIQQRGHPRLQVRSSGSESESRVRQTHDSKVAD